MRIRICRDATCGKFNIPKGDYWVSLISESKEINLVGGGQNFKVPALKRKTKVNSKTTQVTLYCGGGTTWSLIVVAPKFGEWIAMLEVAPEKKD